jgi:hypothetical protein
MKTKYSDFEDWRNVNFTMVKGLSKTLTCGYPESLDSEQIGYLIDLLHAKITESDKVLKKLLYAKKPAN